MSRKERRGKFPRSHTRKGRVLAEARATRNERREKETVATAIVGRINTARLVEREPVLQPQQQGARPVVSNDAPSVDRSAATDAGRIKLPPRLRQIYALRGKTNKEIAAELGITVNTVKAHIQMLSMRLGCRARSEASEAARIA